MSLSHEEETAQEIKVEDEKTPERFDAVEDEEEFEEIADDEDEFKDPIEEESDVRKTDMEVDRE